MKIVYCSDALIPDTPANTVHIMRMCNAFANQGHQVVLCAHAEESDLKDIEDVYGFYGVENNFDIAKFRCPKMSGGALLYALRVKRFIKEKSPDVVYGRSLYCAYFASMIKNARVVLELHKNIEKGTKEAFFFSWLMKKNTLKNIVVISEPLKEHLMYDWNIPENKIILAPDAANECIVSKEVILPGNEEFSLKVGYIGHLYKGKGVYKIIDMARVCEDFGFYIVGGNEKDIENVKAYAGDLANIFFIGYVRPADVANYGVKFDVLLAPYSDVVKCGTEREGADVGRWMSPLKLFEYMSYRKPIICSDLPVLHTILNDGETALFCDKDDIGAWKSALIMLKNDPKLRVRLGENAYIEFKENYTWGQRAKNVLEFDD